MQASIGEELRLRFSRAVLYETILSQISSYGILNFRPDIVKETLINIYDTDFYGLLAL